MALRGNSLFPLVRHSEECLAHPFITFDFMVDDVLMLLWPLDFAGVILGGLLRRAAVLRWRDVFQCGAPHNDASSSNRLSWFYLGPNRNEIAVGLHGNVTSEISYPLL